MGRGSRGKKKKSLTEESDSESPQPVKKVKPLAAAPVLPTIRKTAAPVCAASKSKVNKPTLTASLPAAPVISLKNSQASSSKANIKVQVRGGQTRDKILTTVAKSQHIPELTRLEQLERKKQAIIKDREKKMALQEEKRLQLLQSVKTGKRNTKTKSDSSSGLGIHYFLF